MHVICNKGLQVLKSILEKQFKDTSGLQKDIFKLRSIYKNYSWLKFNCQETFCQNKFNISTAFIPMEKFTMSRYKSSNTHAYKHTHTHLQEYNGARR